MNSFSVPSDMVGRINSPLDLNECRDYPPPESIEQWRETLILGFFLMFGDDQNPMQKLELNPKHRHYQILDRFVSFFKREIDPAKAGIQLHELIVQLARKQNHIFLPQPDMQTLYYLTEQALHCVFNMAESFGDFQTHERLVTLLVAWNNHRGAPDLDRWREFGKAIENRLRAGPEAYLPRKLEINLMGFDWAQTRWRNFVAFAALLGVSDAPGLMHSSINYLTRGIKENRNQLLLEYVFLDGDKEWINIAGEYFVSKQRDIWNICKAYYTDAAHRWSNDNPQIAQRLQTTLNLMKTLEQAFDSGEGMSALRRLATESQSKLFLM